jgi:hypothetical protein
MKEHDPLIRQLRDDLAELRKSLEFWKAHPPIARRRGPGPLQEIRTGLIMAIEATIQQTEQAIEILEAD